MKNVKSILILSSIIYLTSFSINTAEAARDCSNPKNFHEKMMCKLSGAISDKEELKTEKNSNDSNDTGEKTSVFKKLKKVLKQKTFSDAVEESKKE